MEKHYISSVLMRKERYIMNDKMNKAIETLIEMIKIDYENFCTRDGQKELSGYFAEQMEKFYDNIEVRPGQKYIKIIKENSVWGFIVNTENDKKFQYGDILKAAGYNAPARNKARGNVFNGYEIRWTGPMYL
jgi:hypothetical protein